MWVLAAGGQLVCTEMVKVGDTGRALRASPQGPLSGDFKNEEESARWEEDGERDARSRQREEQEQNPEVRARVGCSRDPLLFIRWRPVRLRVMPGLAGHV